MRRGLLCHLFQQQHQQQQQGGNMNVNRMPHQMSQPGGGNTMNPPPYARTQQQFMQPQTQSQFANGPQMQSGGIAQPPIAAHPQQQQQMRGTIGEEEALGKHLPCRYRSLSYHITVTDGL